MLTIFTLLHLHNLKSIKKLTRGSNYQLTFPFLIPVLCSSESAIHLCSFHWLVDEVSTSYKMNLLPRSHRGAAWCSSQCSGEEQGKQGIHFMFYVQPNLADMVLEWCAPWSCMWEMKQPRCISQHAEVWAVCLIMKGILKAGSLVRTWWKPKGLLRFFLVNAAFSLQFHG